MSVVEDIGRFTSAANTTAVQVWVQAVSSYLNAGVGSTEELVELFRATGIPLGSPFGQFGMALSLGQGSAADLQRALNQKTQGDGGWTARAPSVSRLFDG